MDKGLLAEIAAATRLREGPAGVEALLRAVFRGHAHRLADAARAARLPLPVATAVRRELEKAGIFERTKGLGLTRDGRAFAEDVLGLAADVDVGCRTCAGRGVVLEGALAEARDRLARHLEHQPPVDTTLDQAPCTAETALARAALLYRSGALEGKRVVILGDDDSVSLAIGLVGKAIAGGPLVSRLTVLELDPARAAFIGQVAAAEGIPVEVIAHDLREPLPEGVAGAFDTAETDPPYTLEGAGLFLARAVEALEGGRGDVMFSFAHWPAGRMLDLQRVFLDLGLAVTSVHPGFNAYQGASMLAGSGQLFELTATGATAFETGRWDGPLYTADVNPRLRAYRCLACARVTVLGRDGVPATIEALKARGCPACGADRFVRASA